MHNPFYTCIMKNMSHFGLLNSKKKKINSSEKDSEENQRSVLVSWKEHMVRFSCLGKSWGRNVMVTYKIIGGTETGTGPQLFNVSSSRKNRKF